MITHLHGLAKKVSYQQGPLSFPGKDVSLDDEVKSAGIKALDSAGTEGARQSFQKASWHQEERRLSEGSQCHPCPGQAEWGRQSSAAETR